MGLRLARAFAAVVIAVLASAPLAMAESETVPSGGPSNGLDEVKYEAAPRAKQIEPVVVAPVKREMPKTPNIKFEDAAADKPKQVVTIEKDPTLERREAAEKAAAKSCSAGTKPSRDGTRCEKAAGVRVAKKNGKRR